MVDWDGVCGVSDDYVDHDFDGWSTGQIMSEPEPKQSCVYWKTKEGKRINVDDMTEKHAKNTLKMLIRKGMIDFCQ